MNRKISITPVLNGFICEVGCQIVVFESRERLTMTLARYADNPALVEKEFLEKAINREVYAEPTPPANAVCGERARVQSIVDAPTPYETVPPAPDRGPGMGPVPARPPRP